MSRVIRNILESLRCYVRTRQYFFKRETGTVRGYQCLSLIHRKRQALRWHVSGERFANVLCFDQLWYGQG